MQMMDLLKMMVEKKASDLHIKVAMPPGFRISGKIVCMPDHPKLHPEDTMRLCEEIMNPEQKAEFLQNHDVDFAYSVAGLSRFRVNAMFQRGSTGLVIRQIPMNIPTLESLGLPEICKTLSLKPRGLVLVTGPTGSGKSTTLAAMIDYINENEEGHILTMEDPIEFVHHDKKSFVNQREIGADTKDFREALRRALRQDPDVILVGEMRDLETISLAITAAETGHLVFGTLHTTSAIATVDRIIDVFPPEQQQQIRMQLASALQGVISQTLVPKIGGGRIAALEIMVAIDAVRSLVREAKTAQLGNVLQTGSKYGMQMLEASLADLANRKLITVEDAMARASNPKMLEMMIKPGAVHKEETKGSASPAPAAAPAAAPKKGELDLGPKVDLAAAKA